MPLSSTMPSPIARFLARRRAHRVLVALAASAIVGCAGGTPPSERSPQESRVNAPRRPIAEVLAEHTPKLMAMAGVVGTAESALPNGKPSILVLVVKRTPELERSIPRELDGYPVVIEESGEIHAMPDSAR
jgi:hypothetical protein